MLRWKGKGKKGGAQCGSERRTSARRAESLLTLDGTSCRREPKRAVQYITASDSDSWVTRVGDLFLIDGSVVGDRDLSTQHDQRWRRQCVNDTRSTVGLVWYFDLRVLAMPSI
jgi:hypothetical protein